jgi:hypothetical protein
VSNRQRWIVAPVALLVALIGSMLPAAPAGAAVTDLACNYDYVTFNACLHFDLAENYTANVGVGLDATMSQGDAQAIIAAGGPFSGQLFNSTGGRNRFVADLAMAPGWPQAGPGGLGIEMGANVSNDVLDKATGTNTWYAQITYYGLDHQNHTYRTGTVTGFFALPGGGGSGCFITCQ